MTTIVVTRNVPARYSGFLASCMLEVAPGVFLAPNMKRSVREQVWSVMQDWSGILPPDGGVVMFWPKRDAPSGLGMDMVGLPKKELISYEGLWLVVRRLTTQHDQDELDALIEAARAKPSPS
jgi:CRISPR-associated protein Cas2